jgi:hypothetical protein
MPKIVIIADLATTDPGVADREFVLQNLLYWVSSTLGKYDGPYHLTNATVYYGLEDLDADRAQGMDHFASSEG